MQILPAQTVNDVHSGLNATRVSGVVRPETPEQVVKVVRECAAAGRSLALAGGRHAMGGQQFAAYALLMDTRGLDRVIGLDAERGLLTIGAGAQWPAIIAATRAGDDAGVPAWAIRQKQTGADEITLGGSIACNAHGRGLTMAPIADDIERLSVVTATGERVECSRERNAELFSLVIGGYGLFGVVVDATLRLCPRRKMRRLVDIIDVDDALNAVYRRVAEGCVYGDFQYAIDPSDDSFLRRGVFACYKPVEAGEVSDDGADLPREQWLTLLDLAHRDKHKAFSLYARHYLETHGRVYWADTMQLSTYIPTYAEYLAQAGRGGPESLMIGEHYVPPERLADFLRAARGVLRTHEVEDIYGTIRAIRQDTTSFLAWASSAFACVIFNLRTAHSPEGLARSAAAFRGLIDAAADLGGSYFLTYHTWASMEQVLRCYPRFGEFLAKKREYDPGEVFQSEWYRHYRGLR